MADTATVELSLPRWRALAAVLYTAISVVDNPEHRTLFKNLYDDIQKQVNIDVHPIKVDDDS